MAINNPALLDVHAIMAQQAYQDEPPFDDGPTADVAAPNGTYVEIAQVIDGPVGFQARAFFNSTTNDLVISFAGTEGAGTSDVADFLPDLVTDLGLAATGLSPQDIAAQLFVQEAVLKAQIEVGLFGSFDVTYVGHSLGGFLAQTASASGPEGEVVAFNAPGAGGFLNVQQDHPFPEDNFTYIYSDPVLWGLLGGAIHSLGEPLSDNLFIVPGSSGHALTTADATGLSDILNDQSVLVPVGDDIFIPIDEALQLLGAIGLLELFDNGDNGDGGDEQPTPDGIVTGTELDDTINSQFVDVEGEGTTAGDDIVFALTGNDTINTGAGNDTVDGGEGTDTFELEGSWADFRFATGLDGADFSLTDMNTASAIDDGKDSLTSIETLSFSDGSIGTITSENDRIRIDVTDNSGTLIGRSYIDDDGSRAWESINVAYSEDGQREAQTIYYDDGRIAETTFTNGVRSFNVVADINDAFAWDARERTFDENGVIENQVITYDDGRQAQITYNDGVRSSSQVNDTDNAFAWDTRERTFDENGVIENQVITYDDGREALITYNDGVRSSSQVNDTDNAFAWDNRERTFGENGVISDQIITYDDGRVTDVDYLDGIRSFSSTNDEADAYSWSQRETTFNSEGNRVSTTTTFDDGSMNTVFYDDFATV